MITNNENNLVENKNKLCKSICTCYFCEFSKYLLI